MSFQHPISDGDRVAMQPAASEPPHVSTLAAVSRAASAVERLQFRPAAEAWPEGTAPLVRWLRANPDILSELLGSTLTATEEELPGLAGAMFAGPEGSRLLVMVELGESSESTFGAMVTRLTATQAQAALWICGSARPEHIGAMSWLNRSVDARFYIARLRAARIGASALAPVLDLTLRPQRAGDSHLPAATSPSAPGTGRRAEDWQEIALGEPPD